MLSLRFSVGKTRRTLIHTHTHAGEPVHASSDIASAQTGKWCYINAVAIGCNLFDVCTYLLRVLPHSHTYTLMNVHAISSKCELLAFFSFSNFFFFLSPSDVEQLAYSMTCSRKEKKITTAHSTQMCIHSWYWPRQFWRSLTALVYNSTFNTFTKRQLTSGDYICRNNLFVLHSQQRKKARRAHTHTLFAQREESQQSRDLWSVEILNRHFYNFRKSHYSLRAYSIDDDDHGCIKKKRPQKQFYVQTIVEHLFWRRWTILFFMKMIWNWIGIFSNSTDRTSPKWKRCRWTENTPIKPPWNSP